MSDYLHVCLVVDEECLERFEPVVRQLCVGLIDEAILTTIVGPRVPAVEALAMGPVRLCLHDRLTGWRRKRSLAEVLDALSDQPPNLVHALSADVCGLAARLANGSDAPLVVALTGEEDIDEQTLPILKSAACLVAVTEPLRTAAMQRLMRGAQHVVRIRWGLLPAQEPCCFADERKDPTIVSITPLIPQAGLEHLIDALAKLASTPLPAMLFILGTGPAEEELRQRAQRLGLNERVTFAGSVREWSSVLNGADIFVLPARPQRLTIHPLAAMAAGLVVVSAGAGAYDGLIEGQTARLYYPPSAELLTSVLAEVMSNPQESRNLAARAQAYIREHHRVSAMVTETVQLYRKLTLNQRTIPLPSSAEEGANPP